MNITISPETQKLLEEEMRKREHTSADDVVRIALETLNQLRGEDYEDLDDETRAAIERAEAQYQRGEGIPLDEAFTQLRRKHFGN
jgi:Arc/MetJ-type ribon-helix-helix transcriptional regulator